MKKGAALALVALLAVCLAGCGKGSSDDGALPAGAAPSGTVATVAGPAVKVVGGVPEVAGHADATKAFRHASEGCPPTVERDDPRIVSVFWRCAGKASGTTYDLATRRTVALSDLLTGTFESYLEGLAASQFHDDGISDPDVSSILTWYLTPLSLVAIYPAGPIDFPIASLDRFLRRPSPLG